MSFFIKKNEISVKKNTKPRTDRVSTYTKVKKEEITPIYIKYLYFLSNIKAPIELKIINIPDNTPYELKPGVNGKLTRSLLIPKKLKVTEVPKFISFELLDFTSM